MAEGHPNALTGLSPSILMNLMAQMQPEDIISLRQTCKTLKAVTNHRAVWTAALERTCFANKIFGPTFDVSSMSLEALERAATAPFRFFRLLTRKERGEDEDEEFEDRLDRLYGEMFGGTMPRYSPMTREKEMTPTRTHKLRLPPLPAELAAVLANQPAPPQITSARKPTKKGKAPPPAPSKEDEFRSILLVPGGRFLLTCSRLFIHIWDLKDASGKVPLFSMQIKDILGLSAHPEALNYTFELKECARMSQSNSLRFIAAMTPHPSLSRPQVKKLHPGGVEVRVIRRLGYDAEDSPRIHVVSDAVVAFSAKKVVALWNFTNNTAAAWEAFDSNTVIGMHLTPTHILTITEMGDLAINRWPAFAPCPPNALPAFVEPKCDYYLSIYRGDISAAYAVPRPWFYEPHASPTFDSFGDEKIARWTLECIVSNYGKKTTLPPIMPAVHGVVKSGGFSLEGENFEDRVCATYSPCVDGSHVVLPYDQGGVIGYAAYAFKDTGDQAGANDPLAYGTLTPEDGTGAGSRVKATASDSFSLCPASGRLCRIEQGGKQITVFNYLKAEPFVLPPGTKLDVPTLRRLINQNT
ncbi:hypothetical protein K525DRAFT_201726 [Schizophyllum commune Loenen D]|nr:hypothetical protein K525DRAFT_201726 [Schizophyllum commune Loenen D]